MKKEYISPLFVEISALKDTYCKEDVSIINNGFDSNSDELYDGDFD